ncbi:Lrp/AsnC family transcriptional regulator [Gluconobacter cerinus]|uniref:Lrp/AsnC family transcriptional regulator n=1 Tax=Gluconobacter cerinus TaxID=38307 RepID=UPI001B8CF813|nr:Lrp/AsnC family transcriptional regulator [Gluconobacter cerinus]MBS0995525.1 Lrp/AsnC family transcriptional regulator [Gluconobacter cerinus]
MQEKLDDIDRQILKLLQEDASISTADLAQMVGLSQPPCWRRIQRLKDNGTLTKQVYLVDRHKVGLNTQIFANVKLATHSQADLTAFSEAIASFPEILHCVSLLGAVDFLLHIVTTDTDAYQKFLYEKLFRVPGVREVNSMVGLSLVKTTTSLPLPPYENSEE